jgi:hypothetical protein
MPNQLEYSAIEQTYNFLCREVREEGIKDKRVMLSHGMHGVDVFRIDSGYPPDAVEFQQYAGASGNRAACDQFMSYVSA